METISSSLPDTLEAAVFIVMHLPASYRSELPQILGRRTRLSVHNPAPKEEIKPGRIYIAPPDYHLLIERDERISLWHGPKENNFRPAINPLFRSAAEVYGDRVIGIILTGLLEDGVAGLAWVKRHGGITIIQDPEDAAFPQLPQSALRHVPIDFVRPVSEIPDLILSLVNGSTPAPDTSDERRG